MREGIGQHYRGILDHAAAVAPGRPIVATGHLTAVGALSSESERSIQIGNLGAVGADCFAGFDYVALGHIHRPQSVGGNERVRYSGSPIAMGFDEADAPKQVLLVRADAPDQVAVRPIRVPCSRRMLRLRCRLEELAGQLAGISSVPGELAPWLEITIDDGAQHPDLDSRVRGAFGACPAILLKVLATRPADSGQCAEDVFSGRTLAELKPEEVFAERLRREGLDPASEEAKALTATFGELLTRMQDQACGTPREEAR
jgi:exonuclease SbcD